MTNKEELQEKITSLGPWFHNIHLPNGMQTAPDHFLGDFPEFKWKKIREYIPEDLTGKTVLDIGCNAGYYSVKLAQRGAEVTAIDLDPRYLKQAEWILRQFKVEDKVNLKHQQVYDLGREEQQYDLVWFMGLFYHLRYPLFALDIVSEITRELLVFQTLLMPGDAEYNTRSDYSFQERKQMLDPNWPKMAFIEKSFSGDPTNWWVANRSCVEAMLRTCGFNVTHIPENDVFLCSPDTANPGVSKSWNESEYLSALGRDWGASTLKKVQ